MSEPKGVPPDEWQAAYEAFACRKDDWIKQDEEKARQEIKQEEEKARQEKQREKEEAAAKRRRRCGAACGSLSGLGTLVVTIGIPPVSLGCFGFFSVVGIAGASAGCLGGELTTRAGAGRCETAATDIAAASVSGVAGIGATTGLTGV